MANVKMGHFHHVKAAGANAMFVSVMDRTMTEYLIPIYPAKGFVPPDGFGNLEEARGYQNLPFLEFQDVTAVNIGQNLEICTKQGHRFWWVLHPERGLQDELHQQDERGSCREDAGVPRSHSEVS